MQERLNRISEEFNAVNELRRELESRTPKTERDFEELEIIKEWEEEFRDEINNWAVEYNETKALEAEPVVENLSELELLQKELEENSNKLLEIKHQSQKLEPKFSSSEKKNKHQILEANGFILTQTATNRDVRIHQSLVGQFYDLTKERRQMLDRQKQLMKEEERKANLATREADKTTVPELNDAVVAENEADEKKELTTKVVNIVKQYSDQKAMESENKTKEEKIKEFKNEFDKKLNDLKTKRNNLKIEVDRFNSSDNQSLDEVKRLINLVSDLKIEAENLGNEILFGKGLGKKVYIKYAGVNYEVPEAYKSRFETVKSIENGLKKTLEAGKILEQEIELNNSNQSIHENAQSEENETESNENTSVNNRENEPSQQGPEVTTSNEEIIEEPEEEQEVENVQHSTEIENQVIEEKTSIIKSIINKVKNTKFYRNNKMSQIKKLEGKIEKYQETIYEHQNKGNKDEFDEQIIRNTQELKRNAEIKLAQLKEELELLDSDVQNVRQSRTNIKEKIKNNKKKIFIAIAATAATIALVSSFGGKDHNDDNDLIYNQEIIEDDENTNDNIAAKEKESITRGDPEADFVNTETETNIEEKTETETNIEEKTETEKENKPEYFVDNQKYNINGKIYDNMYDATAQQNAYNPYFGEKTEGNIVGWGVQIGDEMIFIQRTDNDYKEKLENLMNQGGKVTTYAISDANSNEPMQITGFYNVNQIKGRSK